MPRRFGDGSAGGGPAIEVADFLTPAVLTRVRNILMMSALVSFSVSRDGGAFSCQVTSQGEWERSWFRSEADLILKLDEWAGLLEDAGAGSPPPPATRRRPRAPRSDA